MIYQTVPRFASEPSNSRDYGTRKWRTAGCLLFWMIAPALGAPEGLPFDPFMRRPDRAFEAARRLCGSGRQQLKHEVAVIRKLIPVRVLDRNGLPIRGLTKTDFALTDNGILQAITDFEAHTSGTDDSSPAPVGMTDRPPAREIPRRLFILFDIQGSDEAGLKNAKRAALHFIDQCLGPGDEAGILSYAPLTGLRLEQYLTNDKERLRRAVRGTREIPLSHNPTVVIDDVTREQRDMLAARGFDSSGPGHAIRVDGLELQARKFEDYRLSLSELALALRYVSGCKSILFFSGGLGESLADPRLGREFAAADAPVFSVDTRNWEYRGSVKRKAVRQSTGLESLALASGGRHFADIERIEELSGDIDRLSSDFYVLGYPIRDARGGQYHNIEVHVSRADARVLVQSGFHDPQPYSEWTAVEKELQFYDLAYGNDPVTYGALTLPVQPLVIPDESVSGAILMTRLLVGETGLPAEKTELSVLVLDDTGRPVVAERGILDLAAASAAALFPYLPLRLPPGTYDGRFVVRSLETGSAGRGASTFEVVHDPTGTMCLSTPLLMELGVGRFMRMARDGRPDADPLTLQSAYEFLSLDWMPVLGAISPGSTRLRASLPIRFADIDQDVHVRVSVLRRNGGAAILLDAEIVAVHELSENRSILLLEMDTADLPEGEFELEFRIGGSRAPDTVVRLPLTR